jgi:hemerythrin
MQASKGKLAIEKMLAFLGDYVVMHFQPRKALMLQHGYPVTRATARSTGASSRTLEGLKAEFERTGPPRCSRSPSTPKVGGWLVRHVLNAVQELGRFCASGRRAEARACALVTLGPSREEPRRGDAVQLADPTFALARRPREGQGVCAMAGGMDSRQQEEAAGSPSTRRSTWCPSST